MCGRIDRFVTNFFHSLDHVIVKCGIIISYDIKDQNLHYRRPSLFADFLSANSIIPISKFVKKIQFLSQKSSFYRQIPENDGTYLPQITRETCIYF